MPKVSIIMGIYNCESTLSEAIDSILSQTFTDWELILCDDGSSDNTFAVAKEYQKKLPQKIILLKNEENLGLNRTLNRCSNVATGEYIARMDGDDISLPTRFEQEVSFLNNNSEYSIVSTPMILFDSNGDWGRTYMIEKPTKQDFIKHSPVHCHAPCMIRREAYLAVNGYTEDKRMLRVEDANLWYKLYASGYIGCNLSEALYKMRDDRSAAKRRSLGARMNFVYVTYNGFRLFGFPWYKYVYVLKELILGITKGLMPTNLYILAHRQRQQKSGGGVEN